MIADERHDNAESRSAIDYMGYNSYADRVVEEDEPDLQNERSGRAIEEGNGRVNNVLGRDQQTSVENEWARN
jgi:hypothetical protein